MNQDLPPDDQPAAASAAEQVYQRLRRLAADPALTLEQARALLAEALDQHGRLLRTPATAPPQSVAASFEALRAENERRKSFLLKLSDELRAAPDARTIQAAVARVTCAFFGADRCYYGEIDGARCLVRHDAAVAGLPSVAGSYDLGTMPLFSAAVAAGGPFVIEDVRTSPLVDASLRALCLQFQVVASLDVPVIKDGQPVGLLCVVQATPRRWTPLEVELATEAAERAWAAVARGRADEELRASEEKYRVLFESMDQGYCIIQMLYDEQGQPVDWRYLEVNSAFEQQNGLHDATGKTIRELAPDIEPKWMTIYGQVAATGRSRRFEESSVALNRVFDLYAFRVGAPGAGQVAVLFTDITTQRRHEQRQQLLLRLSDALRPLTDPAALQEAALALLAAHFGAVRALYFEVEADEDTCTLSARYGLGAVPGQLRLSDVGPSLVAAYRAGRPLTCPDTATDPRRGLGAEAYHRAWATVPLVKHGRLLALVTLHAAAPRAWTSEEVQLLEDVVERTWAAVERTRTARQLAEFNARLERQVAARTRELRDSRDQLQSVFDTSLIAMSVMQAVRDEAGCIQDFRILVVNRELERQTGRQDLVGRLYAQEYPGVVPTGIFALLLRVVATGQPETREYYYGHEGLNRWYASQFVKLGDGVVATNLDVTERRQAEQELRQSLRLLEQSEEVAQSGSWVRELTPAALQWSAGMYRLFALAPGTPVEPAIYQHYAVPDDQPVAARIVRALTTAPADFEETLRLRVGDAERSLSIKGVVVRDATGQPLRLLGVDVDISQVKRLEADNLRLRLRQQHALFEAVLAAQEAERKRIAEALHNGLGQTLYAAKLQLDQLRTPETNSPGARAYGLLADAIRQTRAISHELVPTALAEFGLVAAVQDICHALRSPRLLFSCHLDLAGLVLPQSLQVALYRMAQELAQNIVRHAQATEASLTLETVPGFVLLRAEDNGVGFPADGLPAAGLGLRGIRDRVALLGGAIDVGSAPQVGAYVRIRIPVGAAG